MPERIQIDADLLNAHAARVQQVAADISVASGAASSSNMGGGAFGVLCAFLVGPATLAASMAGSAISAAEGMVGRSAGEIRGVAGDMSAFETDVMAAIGSLESQLP